MEQNLSSTDRAVRGALGVAFVGAGVSVGRRSWWSIALGAVGAVLLFSASKGFCHVYKALGVCTAEKSACGTVAPDRSSPPVALESETQRGRP